VRRLTEEHVLGKWIKELFVNAGVVTDDAYSKLGSTDLSNDQRSEIQYPTVLFEQTVTAVCGPCNNEWMSELEGKVQPFLGPMILRGERTRLTRHDQRHLAAWALKTLLVSQCMQPSKKVFPESVYDQFYKTQEPGNNHMVWLGARGVIDQDESGGGYLLSAASVKPLSEFRVPATLPEKHLQEIRSGYFYVGTLVLGFVALQVFGHSVRLGFDIIRRPPGWLFQIWKPQNHIVWPNTVGIGSLEGLHDSLKPPSNDAT
jgi:hypothetical protein